MKQKQPITKPLLWTLSIIFVAYFLIMFLMWASTIYHEQGHLQACKSVGISCEPQIKSFPEYVSFINTNLLSGPGSFATMSIDPNETEFCSLTEQQQQLIRIEGFRRDIFVSFAILSVLVAQIILFGYLLNRSYTQKKKPTFKFYLTWVTIMALTVLALYSNLAQLSSYFLKNVGELYFTSLADLSHPSSRID